MSVTLDIVRGIMSRGDFIFVAYQIDEYSGPGMLCEQRAAGGQLLSIQHDVDATSNEESYTFIHSRPSMYNPGRVTVFAELLDDRCSLKKVTRRILCTDRDGNLAFAKWVLAIE